MSPHDDSDTARPKGSVLKNLLAKEEGQARPLSAAGLQAQKELAENAGNRGGYVGPIGEHPGDEEIEEAPRSPFNVARENHPLKFDRQPGSIRIQALAQSPTTLSAGQAEAAVGNAPRIADARLVDQRFRLSIHPGSKRLSLQSFQSEGIEALVNHIDGGSVQVEINW